MLRSHGGDNLSTFLWRGRSLNIFFVEKAVVAIGKLIERLLRMAPRWKPMGGPGP